MHKLIIKSALAALVLGGLATAARADVYQTYDLTYSGTPYSNSASATGTVTLDLTAFGADPHDVYGVVGGGAISPYITALSLTVSGSGAGNGTFTLADYNGFAFKFVPIDGTEQLVGQTGFDDLNFFANTVNPLAPSAYSPLTLMTDGGGADGVLITMTSALPVTLAPAAAPEPAQVLSGLLVAGLGGASLLVRRFRNRK